MKKSFSFICKAMAAAFLLSAPVFVTSCGDDDDPQPSTNGDGGQGEDPTKPASVKVAYDITLDQPWYDLFDVIRTVVDENGTVTDTMTTSTGYTNIYNYATAPSEFKLYVVAKPKKNVYELLEADKEYDFGWRLSASVMALNANGIEVPYLIPSSGKKETVNDDIHVKGSQFDAFVESITGTNQGDTLFKAEYTIK